MARTLRFPIFHTSTVLLGLGVLLWLLLRAPVSSPHHNIQAHAPFAVVAWVNCGLESVPPRNSDAASVLSAQVGLCSPVFLADVDYRDRLSSVLTLRSPTDRVIGTTSRITEGAAVMDASPVRAGIRRVPVTGGFTANVRLEQTGLKGST